VGASVRPDDLDALIAARRKAVASPPADDIDALIAARRKAVEAPAEKPGLLDRVIGGVGGAITQAVTHPIDTAESLIVAPIKSAFDAVVTPEVGEARHDPRLSKGGNSSGRPIDQTPYDREHGAISRGERNAAGVQTVVNAALPGVAGAVGKFASPVVGTAVAGALGGAAYTPDDPVAGALTGAIVAPLAHGAVKGVKGLSSGVEHVGGAVIDMAGKRPETTTPALTIRGQPIGSIEGVQERSARLNAEKLPAIQRPATDKPLAPVDLGGIPAQRLARGLKTSSPAAESVLRDALHPRAEGAVDRVIQHGLETTGLASRESGLQVVDDLIAQRAEHGRENFQPVFQSHPEPIQSPEFTEILKTPAGQQALKRGLTIAANRGEKIGRVTEMVDAPAPEGVSPADWEHIKQLAQQRGVTIPQVEGPSHLTPTLQQAHFIKLGFDDMLQSAPEPGSGGSGPNNAAAIRRLKSRWLTAMDDAAPEYGDARKQFADESDLIRAAELGRTLFKLHPDEAAKAFREMSEAERTVARRAGFDALSERIENGPVDVERGVSKPRDQKRMRLLFPDDASFQRFQDGLKHEAQMYATNQSVLGGSITTDKLADVASMAGVALPAIFDAAQGRWGKLAVKAGRAVMSKAGNATADRVAAERARQLVKGANPAGERLAEIIRMEALKRASGRPTAGTPGAVGP
jgi:hypothetical protein